jgi:hypothetical protein
MTIWLSIQTGTKKKHVHSETMSAIASITRQVRENRECNRKGRERVSSFLCCHQPRKLSEIILYFDQRIYALHWQRIIYSNQQQRTKQLPASLDTEKCSGDHSQCNKISSQIRSSRFFIFLFGPSLAPQINNEKD